MNIFFLIHYTIQTRFLYIFRQWLIAFQRILQIRYCYFVQSNNKKPPKGSFLLLSVFCHKVLWSRLKSEMVKLNFRRHVRVQRDLLKGIEILCIRLIHIDRKIRGITISQPEPICIRGFGPQPDSHTYRVSTLSVVIFDTLSSPLWKRPR